MSLNWEQTRSAIMKVTIYLSKIDLLPYLEKFKGETVGDMMDELEKDYPYEDEYSTTLFDVFDADSFVDYLG